MEQEKEQKSLAESARVATMKNETEIRRLNEQNKKLQESVKMLNLEIEHLRSKVSELDQNNANMRQEVFIEKMKVKGMEKSAKANLAGE